MVGKKIFITLMIFSLMACSMVPTYTRPVSPVPTEWPKGAAYKEEKAVPETPRITEQGWQEYFTDGRLQKVITMALENNRDLRIAALNVERAKVVYGIQRAELFPTVNAVGVMNRERVPADLSTTGKSYISDYYSAELGVLSWEIDFFGRIRSLKDKALEQYLATEHASRGVQISLISSVAGTYLVLAADKENLKIAKASLTAQQATYDLIKRRYDIGLTNELDLRRVQTQVDAARGNVALFTRLAAQDENTLNLLAGATVPNELLPSDLDSVVPPEEISPGISSEVLLNRPDILAAEHQLKAVNANIGAARAAFFPRISLTSTVGTGSYDLSRLFQAGSSAWSFAPQIIMPLFDARLWSALKGTKVEREIAVAQYEKAVQVAFKEVSDALAQQNTVEDQMAAQESLVQASADAYRLTTARYSNGIDSYLSVLDAQRSHYAAQQGFIAVRLLKFTNLVTLYKVLGGGGNRSISDVSP
jgi:multidrug efflux system outer membrane protein